MRSDSFSNQPVFFGFFYRASKWEPVLFTPILNIGKAATSSSSDGLPCCDAGAVVFFLCPGSAGLDCFCLLCDATAAHHLTLLFLTGLFRHDAPPVSVAHLSKQDVKLLRVDSNLNLNAFKNLNSSSIKACFIRRCALLYKSLESLYKIKVLTIAEQCPKQNKKKLSNGCVMTCSVFSFEAPHHNHIKVNAPEHYGVIIKKGPVTRTIALRNAFTDIPGNHL